MTAALTPMQNRLHADFWEWFDKQSRFPRKLAVRDRQTKEVTYDGCGYMLRLLGVADGQIIGKPFFTTEQWPEVQEYFACQMEYGSIRGALAEAMDSERFDKEEVRAWFRLLLYADDGTDFQGE